jgi:hypothetical protein
MIKSKHYSFNEFKELATMFYVDDEFEKQFDEYINQKVDDLYNNISVINSREGLIQYIASSEEALADILALIGLSAEKFKRIVSLIRIWNGEKFRTEWELDIVRNQIIRNPEFADKICNLFLNGRNDKTLKKFIPKFYLDYITIDEHVMDQLKDKDRLKRLIKHKQDGKYNNDVGDQVEYRIMRKLEEIKAKYGFGYEREQTVSWITRNLDFVIPCKEDPYVIIESSYQITTSSGQTTKQRDETGTSQTIRLHNIQNNKNIAFVNFLEGAGWVARQSDMEKIVNCSDYVINLSTLDMLESIVIKHVPDKYFTKQPKPVEE